MPSSKNCLPPTGTGPLTHYKHGHWSKAGPMLVKLGGYLVAKQLKKVVTLLHQHEKKYTTQCSEKERIGHRLSMELHRVRRVAALFPEDIIASVLISYKLYFLSLDYMRYPYKLHKTLILLKQS